MNYNVESYRWVNGEVDWKTKTQFMVSAKPYNVLARFLELTGIKHAQVNQFDDMIEVILEAEIYFIEEQREIRRGVKGLQKGH